MTNPAAPAPPWLVFWLGTALVWTIPRTAGQWWSTVLDLVGATANPAPAIVGSDLLSRSDVVDLVPALVIAAAVVCVLGAGIRGRIIESRFHLRPQPHGATITAIAEFAGTRLPGVEVLANLNRTDQFAFAYFRGPRRPRLAVFAPMVPLWRDNRAAAQAIVLHEINHCRQGDNALLGAVSPFATVLRRWPMLFVCAAVIPIGSVWLADTIDFLRAVGPRGTAHTIAQVFTLLLPDLGLMLISAAGLLLAAITMPVAASWSAEFNADHVAAADLPAGMIDATRLGRVPGGLTGWLFSRLTHPPIALRRILLRAGPRATAVAAVVCYPLGWLALLAGELISANATWLLLRLSPDTIAEQNYQAITTWRDTLWPVWLAAGIFLMIWPLLRPQWSRLWTSPRARQVR